MTGLTSDELRRLTWLCACIDHLEAHGKFEAAQKFTLERDALLSTPPDKKGKR